MDCFKKYFLLTKGSLVGILFLLFFVFKSNNTIAQGPQQMFWALNKNNLLLDMLPNFTTSAAYSVRKLRKGYTGFAMRVRKQVSGTDPQGDVAFDANGFVSANSLITITTAGGGYSVGNVVVFSTFYAGDDVYVRTWYDQSTAANHATQTTTADQPQIVSGGTLLTENTRASIEFRNAHGGINLPLTSSISLTNGTLFGICRAVTPGITIGIAENGTYSYNINTFNNSGRLGVTHYTIVDVTSGVSYNSGLDAMSWSKTSSSSVVEVDTRTASSNCAINIPIAINQIYGNALSGNVMRISELIIGSYTNSTTRAAVFANQKLVFSTP